MQTLNVIMIGAHPDDCEVRCGGTAIRFAQSGSRVKFVSMTDGAAGHQTQYGPEIRARRRREADEAMRRTGIAAYDILDNPDGGLEPTIANRERVIRLIREWEADIVVTHRPNDYHPDHRYTSILVQDSAYMVMVPGICPETPPLRKNPVYFYMEDGFTKPYPFQRDAEVDVAPVWQGKLDAVAAHESQFVEWLPWIDPNWAGGAKLEDWPRVEAFELCEYGRRPAAAEMKTLFPH